jgi:hypothetical protein
MRWQQRFAAISTAGRRRRAVRGFSPPEMHLPNHPDAAFEFVKAAARCGYRWLLVQEHTVETLEGRGLGFKHLPHRLIAHAPVARKHRSLPSSRRRVPTRSWSHRCNRSTRQGLQRQDVGESACHRW